MRLIFHGELKRLYGDSFVMKAETVREAVEGFSRQALDWPKDMRISIVGFDTEAKLYEQPDEVHLMPSLSGGGGKFGTILLGAALIAVAAFAAPLGIAAAATSLYVAGGVMILQGIMGLFLKSPKLNSNGSNDPDASKYISVNQNTTQVGSLITAAWGRVNLSGQWLSLQSDSSNLAFGVFPASTS